MSVFSKNYGTAIRNAGQRFKRTWERSIQVNFEQQGRPKWDDSSKKKKDPALMTLSLNGYLKNSIQVKRTGNKVVASSAMKYAKIHNDGWSGTVKAHTRTIKKGKNKGQTQNVSSHKRVVPARPFLPPQDKDMKMLRKYLLDELQKNVGGK